MREYAWLERPVSWKQWRIFGSILDRTSLAHAWIAHESLDRASIGERVRLKVPDPAAGWIEAIPIHANEAFFGDWCRTEIGARTPEQALLELGRAARVLEQVVAVQILDSAGVAEVSRDQGRRACQRHSVSTALRGLGSAPATLGNCAMAIHQSAMGWLACPSEGDFLVERETPDRLDWILLECAHHDDLLSDPRVADFLCAQHTQWMRGFADSLDSRLVISERPKEPQRHRCRLSMTWSGDAYS